MDKNDFAFQPVLKSRTAVDTYDGVYMTKNHMSLSGSITQRLKENKTTRIFLACDNKQKALQFQYARENDKKAYRVSYNDLVDTAFTQNITTTKGVLGASTARASTLGIPQGYYKVVAEDDTGFICVFDSEHTEKKTTPKTS